MTKYFYYQLLFILFGIGLTNQASAQDLITASLTIPGNAGILSESCGGPYELVIRRTPANDSATSIFISGDGTATIGIDYTFSPDAIPVEMAPTDSIAIIPITVVADGIPEGTETVELELAFLAGTQSGIITLNTSIVDEYEVEIQSADTIVWCRNIPYVLLASSNAEEIFWSPAEYFDDSLGTAATVRPFESGWYYASVGSDTCGAKDSVYFDLAIVDIANPDTVYICLDGNGVALLGSIDGLATDFTWIPSDSTLSDTNVLNPIANPTVTTTYILQSDIGVCTATDRVVVRVDSLPKDLHIDIAAEKPYYCAGEVVALFSPTFDSLMFPDILFQWLPDPAFDTPLTFLNAAVTLQDTTYFKRDVINNACRSRDSILVNVVPPSVPLSTTDTTLCPGEMFTVVVLNDQVTEPEWTPEEGLSCTACLDPKVTVLGALGMDLVYQFSGKILECPVGAALTIHIPGLQTINISGDNVVCEGDIISLAITNPAGLTNIQWNVQSGTAALSCSDCINPTVTVLSGGNIDLVVTADTDNPSFCGASGSITLIPGQTKQFTGPEFQACFGDTITIGTNDPNAFDLQWSILSGDVNFSCIDCDNPVVTLEAPVSVLRFIGNTNEEGFCNVSGTVTVKTFIEDISNLAVTPDPPIGQGSQVMVTLNAVPPPSSIMWTVNGSNISATTATIEFNADEEVNFIEAKFINSKGCEQIDTISIATVPPSYTIPNAFTPNNDDTNDHFKVVIMGNVELQEFLIFNRWGQLVYEAPEGDLTGWDGRFNNEPAASDTYVYKARLAFPNGRTEIAKGDVMLLR